MEMASRHQHFVGAAWMVYFLRRNDGVIKIGHSINPETRRKQLESAWRCDLELVVAIPGGRDAEQEIHEQFDASRIDPRQEWFEPSAELVAYIDALPRDLVGSPDS